MINIYMVTRMSESKNDVPNLGMHFTFADAEDHFMSILEDRRGKGRQYKCKIEWVRECEPDKTMPSNVIREAYIKHPKGKYQDAYVEMLRIEQYTKRVNPSFLKSLFLESL